MSHERLREILVERSLLVRPPHDEPFTLSSGKKSWHYLDVDRTTSYGPALPLIAEAICNCLPEGIVAIGGPTRGADPLATAAAVYSALYGPVALRTFSILKEPKRHGIPVYIEGSILPGDEVAVVDDVLTTGTAVISAIQECWDHDLRVGRVIVLLDREEGGLEKLQDYVGPEVVQVLFPYSALVNLK